MTLEHNKREVFSKIYAQYVRKVRYFAYSYLKDMQIAENVAHDVFVALWNKWEHIDITDNIASYLMVSAKNACLNYIRKEKHLTNYKDYSQKFTKTTIHYAALADESATLLYSKETEKIVSTCIAEMPPKIKSTFVLSRFKKMKYDEIAELQGISVKTVEFRISYALKMLRSYLKKYLASTMGYLLIGLFLLCLYH